MVVVRLVYDGPPRAGKTTSIRALGRSLVRHVDTPQEIDGRTVFFDWMEYTAGLFEGHPIRCQIVSVPGQPNLAPRRKALLLAADAVVFVADTSSPDSAARSADYVTALARLLREVSPPVGVVVQANKRDAPEAIGIPRLRALMGNALSGVAISESVAHEGQGTRETFVLAVRLALDRVRELVQRGELPRGRPEVDSAEELLASFEQLGSMTELPNDEPAVEMVRPVRPRSLVPRERAPLLPDVRVPSGAIWPAVEGRLILHEAVSGDLRARRGDRDAWVAGMGTGWRIHSAVDAEYSGLDAGRQAVVAWARAHTPRIDFLSPGRCIVLADAGEGAWRLWQIVRAAPSLRRWLLDLAYASDPATLLDALGLAASTLYEAAIHPQGTGLSITFDSVGRGDQGPQLVGLMPGTVTDLEAEPIPDPELARRSVQSQLEALLSSELWDRLQDLREALRARRSRRAPDEWRGRVKEAIEATVAS